MKDLNYAILQPLSKNTSKNKSDNSEKHVGDMLGLLDYQSNFEELVRKMSAYDAASLLIAEQDWIKRHKFNTYKNPLSEGQIIKVDFGKTYDKENAYIHFALYMGKYEGKLLVIPMTTSNDEINIAYHPMDNTSGEFRLRLGLKSEGFTAKVALYMNDVKFISAGRVISSGSIINTTVYKDIQLHLLNITFPAIGSEYRLLKEQNKKLIEKIEELNNNIKLFEENIQKSS